MQILIFEWLSSGGLWHDRALLSEDCPIQHQGGQMLNAVASDLVLAGAEVVAMVDSRLPTSIPKQLGVTQHQVNAEDDLPSLLLSLAKDADRVLTIAPETNSILNRCLNWLESVEHKLLNPDAAFTKLASNKSDLFEYLKSNGWTQFPKGLNFETFLDQVEHLSDKSSWSQYFPTPAVLKPVDGAGSEEVFLIADWSDFDPPLSRASDQYRLEEFVPGTPVSVSVLCGGDGCDVLAPTIQMFEKFETTVYESHTSLHGHYAGAKFPIPEHVSTRAIELACQVIQRLPKTRGYIGMDLVISDSDDRSRDCLIEINPRHTMSYRRLSEIYGAAFDWRGDWGGLPSGQSSRRSNLAMRMIEKAIEPQTDSPIVCTFQEPLP